MLLALADPLTAFSWHNALQPRWFLCRSGKYDRNEERSLIKRPTYSILPAVNIVSTLHHNVHHSFTFSVMRPEAWTSVLWRYPGNGRWLALLFLLLLLLPVADVRFVALSGRVHGYTAA